MPQNFYELVWIFIIYAFIGWCTEVAYATLNTGKFVNRGFLNGPYCPIYGCGVVIVVAALTPIKENLFILFAGSLLLTSTLEYITGFVLEKVFHNKWWDYSDKPFNIHGYVCLKFSIYWGLACTFIMEIVHPAIYAFITKIPFVLGVILVVIFMGAFSVDMCVTVSTILKFNKRLRMLDEIAAKMRVVSDEIGENIHENVTTVLEKSEEFQKEHEELIDKISEKRQDMKQEYDEFLEKVSEKREGMKQEYDGFREKISEKSEGFKQDIREDFQERREKLQKESEELSQKYKELLEQKNFGFKRLMKAFPDMTSRDQNEALEKYKKYFNIRKWTDKGESKDES